MTGSNLIPLPRRQAQRVRTALRRWTSIAIAYGVVVTAALVGAGAAWDTDHSALDQRLDELQRRRQGLQDSVNTLKARLETDQRKLAADRAISLQPDWGILLAVLPRSLGDDAALTRLALQQDPLPPPTAAPTGKQEAQGQGSKPVKPAKPTPERAFTLKLSGVTSSQSSPGNVVVSLEKLEIFDRVKLVETRREAGGKSDLITFEIECRLAGAPAAPAEKKE